jgi:hypothetical protein
MKLVAEETSQTYRECTLYSLERRFTMEATKLVGKELIRIRGTNKGRRAKGKSLDPSGKLIVVEYVDTGVLATCHPSNFTLIKDYQVKQPYRPEAKTLGYLQDPAGPFKIGEKKYIVLPYGKIDYRLLSVLIKKRWLSEKIRFADIPGKEEFATHNPNKKAPDSNISCHQILKDLGDFTWD